MDPDQAWKDLSDAFQVDDADRCAELAHGLVDWLEKDGYPPAVTRHQAFDRHVVKSTCESILAKIAG